MAKTLLHLPLDGLPLLIDHLRPLPSGMRLYACYVLAHQSYLEKDYGRALGIAEIAFGMQDGSCPLATIYLLLAMSMSLMSLKRVDEAREHFMDAWNLARPDDLIQAFGEHHGLLQGLIESCLKPDYPQEYNRIIAITYRFSATWRRVHNPAASDTVADNLSTTQFTVAMLANRDWTNAEIAGHLNLSVNTVKRYLSDVYRKLGISRRHQLQQFMLR